MLTVLLKNADEVLLLSEDEPAAVADGTPDAPAALEPAVEVLPHSNGVDWDPADGVCGADPIGTPLALVAPLLVVALFHGSLTNWSYSLASFWDSINKRDLPVKSERSILPVLAPPADVGVVEPENGSLNKNLDL